MKKIKLNLIHKLIISIIIGVLTGYYMPIELVRVFKTISIIFGNFLSFFIPLMILGFIVSGISRLSQNAGILLAYTTFLSYISTISAGILAYFVSSSIFPHIISKISMDINNSSKITPYFTIKLNPIFDVTTALALAFLFGLSISYIKNNKKMDNLYNLFQEFEQIVILILKKIIIPLLPLYIMSIFIELSYTKEVFSIILPFIKIYAFIFIMHYTYILFIYFLAAKKSKKSIVKLIKNQVPAYFTAIGTQSSAATIPINIESGIKNGTSHHILNFVIPLCANIHLAGSIITLTSCIMGILIINNMPFNASLIIPFIFTLGIAMIAAPGAPGGAVMSSIPFLSTIGITNPSLIALLIALYITQDSFGTAINVSGDNAIAILVDEFNKKIQLNKGD